MTLLKRILFIVPLFSLFSCLDDNSGFDYEAGQFEVLFSAMLTEYNQQDETIYSFTYKGWNLNSMTYHRSYGDLEFKFEYDDRKMPVKASATYSERLFEYYFYYDNGLLATIEQRVDDILFNEVNFTHDDMERIVRTAETKNGATRIRDFTWEDYNIVKIEAYSEEFGKDFAQVFEFEYDDREAPLRTAFHFIGYNLIDKLPITYNNWTKLTMYRALNPAHKDVLNKEFDYYGNGFPFREIIKYRDQFGDLRESETNFVY